MLFKHEHCYIFFSHLILIITEEGLQKHSTSAALLVLYIWYVIKNYNTQVFYHFS